MSRQCITCGARCEATCPLCGLLDAIVDAGTGDIYTDAPEYEGRVAATQNLIELLQAYRAGAMRVTCDSLSKALAPRELDFEDRNETYAMFCFNVPRTPGKPAADFDGRVTDIVANAVARTLNDGRTVGIECGCHEELAEEEEIETNG
jgi:hypothetical protein